VANLILCLMATAMSQADSGCIDADERPRNVLRDITNISTPTRTQSLTVSTEKRHGGARVNSGRQPQRRKSFESMRAAGTAASAAKHRKQQQLQSDVDRLANPPGRSLSANELRIIIRIAMCLQLNHGYSEFSAIESASVWAGSSRAIVHQAYAHYVATHELVEPDTSARGSGNARHRRHDSVLSFQQILAIHRELGEAKCRNEFMPARVVQQRVGFALGLRQTQRILKQLGYTWGRKQCISTASKQQTAQRTRSFIRQYADALQQQTSGKAVIVYTDESYIHTTHSNQYVWYSKSASQRNCVSALASKGKRLILLHAISEHGLLHGSFTDGAIAAAPNDVSKAYFNCELIFESLIDSEDYHKNMDGQVYMQWIHNRLIHTFKHRFPGKKLILVLDNAKYHHPRGADWINPNLMTKLAMATWISEHSNGINIQRDGTNRYFGRQSLFERGGKHSPTIDEMKQWIKTYLVQHPHMNRTLLRKAFDAEGWQLVYTPPYQCESQPIEMLWAYVKNYVGRQMKNDHSVEIVTSMTRRGFYGDEANNHAPVSDTLCKQLIYHVHTWCNAFIASDTELQGTVDDLAEIFVPADDPFDDIDDAEDEHAILLAHTDNSDDEDSDDST
jgi:hypothetical protein